MSDRPLKARPVADARPSDKMLASAEKRFSKTLAYLAGRGHDDSVLLTP